MQKKCIDCGLELNVSETKHKKIRCSDCVAERRFQFLTSDSYIKANFTKTWSRNLYFRYSVFLAEHRIVKELSARYLSKVSDLFLEAEKNFSIPQEITEEWLENEFATVGKSKNPKASFASFLAEEGVISLKSENQRIEEGIARQIEKVPAKFRRLIEVYYNEKMFLRTRQLEMNASKPLSMRTISSDILLYSRLSKWIDEKFPDINSWDLLQEEQVNSFLLTLQNQNREIARKTLLALFKLAKKKRIITHIPMYDMTSREYPRSIEALTIEEQRILVKKLRNNIYSNPLGTLLTSFCFYHGLSSGEIKSIKINHIDIEKRSIHISGRPPVFLMNEDVLMLEEYLKERSKIKSIEKKTFLIVSKGHSYQDLPVSNKFINNKVKELTSSTPKRLRITCFTALSSFYGPQYLIDAFGLSLTQASRYGKLEEYLLEEEVREQRESFLEMSSKHKEQ